ncbi:PP2C family protein-serine/threonine phosphatase [Wohlfahrtiimonas chitiniclastica]|uniref:PP2C family protein-serine/threonine phosphatase n=1 Tax=Wohlfahrtiimonas chitiniclastica TaxID=400946 RepID=UPI000B99C474|nr:protein phosphatase 2C domain-containing protein [Wohlfahrtiimonas chitiniclastica]OYQ76061.1 hypothetical protein B9T18_01520 [Wohlfahrtiimonas chitiniclastica]
MFNIKSVASFSEPRDNIFLENRKNNEDSFVSPIRNKNGYVFCIADGLGSYKGALNASRFVCRFLEDKKNIDHSYLSRLFADDLTIEFGKYIQSLDKEYIKAATTLSVCFLDEFGLSIWHAGDCRVYIKKDKKLIQMTSDHTQYQKLLSKKIYTKKELEEHGIGKNTLTTAISLSIPIEEEYLFIPMGDLRKEYGNELSIIIMSDGAHHFWDLRRRFSEKTMSDIVKLSSALQRRIERMGAIDDYTVVAATFDVQNIADIRSHKL